MAPVAFWDEKRYVSRPHIDPGRLLGLYQVRCRCMDNHPLVLVSGRCPLQDRVEAGAMLHLKSPSTLGAPLEIATQEAGNGASRS
jgi:hypothetical protein